jgi:hypothetical protein
VPPGDSRERLFARFVTATLVFAAGGLAVGLGPRWAALMKFYPFRLADVFVPLAAAAAAARTLSLPGDAPAANEPGTGSAGLAETTVRRTRQRVPMTVAASVWIVAAVSASWVAFAPAPDRNPSGWTSEEHRLWREACDWIREHTEPEALFLTPRYNIDFKWYAWRAEYATWKDCPQDAKSLAEWKRRLDQIHRWRVENYRQGFTREALASLSRATGIDYIVGWRADPWPGDPLFANELVGVYRAGNPAPAGRAPNGSSATLQARE